MLIEHLRAAATDVPDQAVVESASGSLTYSQCLAWAEALARGLDARSIERFACSIEDVGGVLALLCASSLVGSEACVYPGQLDDRAIADYATSFGHEVVVTDRHRSLASAQIVLLDSLPSEDGAPPERPAVAPFMILTTGTTGRPRGARHDWSRLLASVRHPDDRVGNRWLLAYNVNQFAGIQVLLHVLVSRATLIVPPSRRPRDLVTAISEQGVTHISATPTFWQLLSGAVDETLARKLALRQITLGGEAVPGRLLERLASLFPEAHISQVYAATEFGSGVSVRDGRNGLPISLLSRGDDADVQMRIVDGQLHVRSRVGMLGYYGEGEASDGWRPTGDLVEVRGNRIYFVGRSNATVNVGGVKVHPYPVEDLVGGLDGVALVRAYGHPNPVTGEILAVDVVARRGSNTDLLEHEIRDVCRSLGVAAQPRRIRFVQDIEVQGQKVARRPTASTG
jgi:acyl-CoA synthetase (AMP-forming)/AMP-acid ligase II